MSPGLRTAAALAAAALLVASCGGGEKQQAPRPNVLWIVWDTVRADRLGVYGYDKPTTPFLDEWAKGARVYEDCISPGSWTVPSHASMFTGLLPSEHGAEWDSEVLGDELTTIAELLQGSGYQTFCWTANPHVSKIKNATQGFEVEQHPWDPETIERAKQIFAEKLETFPPESEVRKRGADERQSAWVLKAAGGLADEGLNAWLAQRDESRPYFAFLNYMEAHRPLISPPEFREPFMTPEEVVASYAADIDWISTWSYCFGVTDLDPVRLDLLAKSYDAAIRELDALLRVLLAKLEASGALENTIVVLTSDHGEHLTEHHLLDHQYSVAQVLLRVPLIVHYPARFAPGRDARPVMSMDLFPTLLELAGVESPRIGVGHARSLLDPARSRARISQYTRAFPGPLKQARDKLPDVDVSRHERPLMAIVDRPWKLVEEVGGAARLYDVEKDPYETRDVSGEHPDVLERMRKQLRGVLRSVRTIGSGGAGENSEEMAKFLEALGYVDVEQNDSSATPAEKKPGEAENQEGEPRR